MFSWYRIALLKCVAFQLSNMANVPLLKLKDHTNMQYILIMYLLYPLVSARLVEAENFD